MEVRHGVPLLPDLLVARYLGQALEAARQWLVILRVEQYFDFARALADQYLVMERGEIIKQGEVADMDKDGVRELLSV